MASSLLRIAVVQFAPKLGEVHANIAKARELCRGLTPRSVDLVCFPEMIFTGYMFPDAPSIAPYLEHPKTGPTASFCAELAKRLGCVVIAGYPERLDPPLPQPSSTRDAAAASSPVPTPESHLVGANAALVCDAQGRLVHTYHKSNLFSTDRTWARPGPGFTSLPLPLTRSLSSASDHAQVRVGVAICNDLNVRTHVDGTPGEWLSLEHGPYELGEWCQREGVRVLVLLNAWLRAEDGGMEGVEGEGGGEGGSELVIGRTENEDGLGDKDGDGGGGGDALEPNWRVLNYWASRLRPLWAALNSANERAPNGYSEGTRANENREVIVVVCNRFGRERGKTFAGSSSMFVMRPGLGRPRLLHVMGEREEGVCVWTGIARVGSQTVSS